MPPPAKIRYPQKFGRLGGRGVSGAGSFSSTSPNSTHPSYLELGGRSQSSAPRTFPYRCQARKPTAGSQTRVSSSLTKGQSW